MKILLAVDGSEYTRKMLDYVCANKALFDAGHTYTLLNTQTPLPPHARAALALVPYWHYVRDILLPQIQRAKTGK